MSFLPVRTIIPCIQSLTVQSTFIRCKGHNKWSNIKHIKAANDALNAKKAQVYVIKISHAIRENNMVVDQNANKVLEKVVKEAISVGVPKTTIENAIKNAKGSTDVEHAFEVRGPGRVGVIVEMVGKNEGSMRTNLNSILKKNGGLVEKGILNMFDKKGVIVIAKNSHSLDQVEEDAIEFGAEDVDEDEDIFTMSCSPGDFTEVLNKVKDKYQVEHSQVEYVPNLIADGLNRRDKALFKGLCDALEKSPNVTAVHHNCEF